MSIQQCFSVGIKIPVSIIAIAVLLVACSGSSKSSTSSSTNTTTNIINKTGTGSSALTTIPTASGNSVPVIVDGGPVAGSSSVNVGYVTVTVCPPGTTAGSAACQTIDHVTLDTGSYGLRLLNSVLSSNLTLPAVTSSNGQAIGECVQFVVGSIWGSVRKADIYIGGEVAKNVSIHDIGDYPGGAPNVPTDCASSGTIQDTLATLGSNGILGVGPFINDCDICLIEAYSPAYYTCTSTGCSNSSVTASQVVRNPVAGFTTDNNGTLITFSQTVPPTGLTSLTGTLYFGIGTQSNNGLTGTVYAVNNYGEFTTTYNGSTLTASYLDSGSNGLFFNDTSIPKCTVNTWTYCPTSTMTLSAANGSSGITVTSPAPTIVAADTLFSNYNIVAGNIGGPGSKNSFAWGLPFFYGRSVFTAIKGVSVTGVQSGPFWAY
jgi:hypothetical protein